VTLSDGDVAALADQAADRLAGRVEVRIQPDSGDDPYRWGTHSWLVHFAVGPGEERTAVVRLSAQDSEQEAAARLAGAVDSLIDRTAP
jgi:hypothetical protein